MVSLKIYLILLSSPTLIPWRFIIPLTRDCFQKATWSAKPIKEKKSDEVFQKLIFRTEELIFKNLQLPVPEIPTLPANIALTPKPNKEDIITTQISRFSSKK